MKIYELIKELNKKVTMKNTRVMDVKKYYLSMYRAHMVYMYDRGYVSDPTVFNLKEILGNIVDLDIKHLTGVNGKIELGEDYIGYAMCRYKDCPDKYDFLSLLYKVIKYRNISMNLDKFYDDSGFSSEAKKKVSLNLVQSASKITNKNGYVIDEGIIKCFKGLGTNLKLVTLDDKIYKLALEELGIEDNSENSLFVKGLTRDEEIKYANIILNGLVKLDGDFSEKLTSWLKRNKWAEDNRFSSQKEGLYNWATFIKSNNTIEEQSALLNSLLDEGHTIACMRSNGFYIIDNCDTMEYPIGIFAISSKYDEEDEILPRINVLEGFTGEVYSVQLLENDGFSYVGCPIELYVDNKNKELFIDKEQTEMAESISWFKYVGGDIEFEGSHYVEGVFCKDSMEDMLFKAVGDSENGCLIGRVPSECTEKVLESTKKAVVKKLQF